MSFRSSWMAPRLAQSLLQIRRLGELARPWRHGWTVILWSCVFLVTCNVYLLATIFPAVVRDLHTTVSGVESALLLFPLITGILLPAGTTLVRLHGRREVVAVALAILALGLVVAAASPSAALMIFSYGMMSGVAAAGLIAAAWSLLDEAASPRSRAFGMALLASAPLAGSAAGPLIGGLAADESSWRLALGAESLSAVMLLVAVRRLPSSKAFAAPGVRWTSSLGVLAGAAAVLVGVGLADEYGWWRAVRPLDLGGVDVTVFGLSVVPLLLGAGVMVFSFSVAGAGRPGLALYGRPRFAAYVAITLGIGAASTGALYVLLLYFSLAARLDELQAGISLVPFGVGAVLANLAVLATDRPANLTRGVALGIVISVAGAGVVLAGLAEWGAGWGSAPGLFVLGAGNGLALSRLSNLTLGAVEATDQAEASAISTGAGNLAYAVGLVVLGAVFIGAVAHSLVVGVERQLIERQAVSTLPPAVRLQIEARLEDDLRTMTPAQQDAYVATQPVKLRTAIISSADGAYRDGIRAALEVAIAGFATSMALLLIATRLR